MSSTSHPASEKISDAYFRIERYAVSVSDVFPGAHRSAGKRQLNLPDGTTFQEHSRTFSGWLDCKREIIIFTKELSGVYSGEIYYQRDFGVDLGDECKSLFSGIGSNLYLLSERDDTSNRLRILPSPRRTVLSGSFFDRNFEHVVRAMKLIDSKITSLESQKEFFDKAHQDL